MLKKLIPKFYGSALNFQAFFSKETAGRNALRVYSKVRKGSVLPIQKEFLDAAKHQQLHICDVTIQTYHWSGKGKKVVLVHGWESNTYRWRMLVEKLQEADFDIYAFDAPANGYSSGKILNHWLYQETLQKVKERYRPEYLIGHSMGGMTIMYNQYLNPDAIIKKIVTIASPSEYHELMRYYKNLLSLSRKVMNALQAHIKHKFGFQFHEFSTAHFAKTNSKTGLLIHDKDDEATPYWCSEQVHTNWKNSKLITTEGLGHSIQDDAINGKIIDFLKS